jgi:murein DD-endopeptidase MepM/ murein hydrolase activator NlpD
MDDPAGGRKTPVDRWVRLVPVLVLLHLAFFATTLARPGRLGVVLWRIGPSALVILTAALLAAAFLRARRGVRLTRARIAGYAALVLLLAPPVLYRTYPSSRDHWPSGVRFRLPLDGPVTVVWGGATVDVNYHASDPSERWAYDLLVTRDGRSFEGDGTRLDDYYAYGRPVLAPAGGLVRAVADGADDRLGRRARAFGGAGNHVVIEVAPGEYLFVAHLQRGSIGVRPGDRIAAGQPVGRVGNSGNSSEPHVHLHLQDTPDALWGEGIPFFFHDYREDGRPVERGMPTGGFEDGIFRGRVVEKEQ